MTETSDEGEHLEVSVAWKERSTKARPKNAKNLPAGDMSKLSYEGCECVS